MHHHVFVMRRHSRWAKEIRLGAPPRLFDEAKETKPDLMHHHVFVIMLDATAIFRTCRQRQARRAQLAESMIPGAPLRGHYPSSCSWGCLC